MSQKIYSGGTAIAGRLQSNAKVEYKEVFTKEERSTLWFFLILILTTSFSLIWFVADVVLFSGFSTMLLVALSLVLLVEILRVLQSATLLVFAFFAKDPIPMTPSSNLRVAILTTIVPGKEPIELVEKTLKEMKKINAGKGNTVDVWLLDEGNDPDVKSRCEALGVKHFSRKGIKRWNGDFGPFRAKTKHGNHNAWRSKHEKSYDIVAQMDPDHVPRKNFLLRTLGYFKDPDIGFVVAPQVYGNSPDNWIARASACQAYVFHGVIQRGGNGMDAPLLIGTNHLYRVKTFKDINGYQDSIIEDHLTSMIMSGAKNKKTGNNWKGVYTPDILAVGEGPTSFTDYFNQQKRWAYGICDIARKHTKDGLKNLTGIQKLTFLMLQYFYPSLAVSWILGAFVTLLFGLFVVGHQELGAIFAVLWINSVISCLALFFWLRRFNLVEHERKDYSLHGIALTLMCLPVYVSAAWEAITRKPLTFAVTAKGNLASPDNLFTFMPHIKWLTYNVLVLLIVLLFKTDIVVTSVIWLGIHSAICLTPMIIHMISKIRSQSLALGLKKNLTLPSIGDLRLILMNK